MTNLTILKLGGSVITYKDSSPPKVNFANVERIAEELKGLTRNMVIILGGGAHGHQAAQAYGYNDITTPFTQLIAGIPSIRHNMSLLSLAVEEKLQAAGLPAVVISPFSFALMNDGVLQEFPTKIIENCLNTGCVVVTHGDVCFDKTRCASILSGDTIAAYLAKNLGVKSIYIGTNVDGVFNGDPQTNPQAIHIPIIDSSNIHNVLTATGPSDTVDVTGGMYGKIRELLELAKENTEIVIFNLTVPDRLSRLLAGESVICTRIQL